MATLTPFNTLDDSGESILDLVAGLSAAVDLSNDFFNDGNLILFVNNGDAAPHTITIESQPDPFGRGGGVVGDMAVVIAAGDLAMISLLNPAMWNGGGKVTPTLSALTSMTLGLVRLRKLR